MRKVPDMIIEQEAAFDGRAFRQALGQFPTGVCVVTCLADGEQLGMTMSSFNSLSLDPPSSCSASIAVRQAYRYGR